MGQPRDTSLDNTSGRRAQSDHGLSTREPAAGKGGVMSVSEASDMLIDVDTLSTLMESTADGVSASLVVGKDHFSFEAVATVRSRQTFSSPSPEASTEHRDQISSLQGRKNTRWWLVIRRERKSRKDATSTLTPIGTLMAQRGRAVPSRNAAQGSRCLFQES